MSPKLPQFLLLWLGSHRQFSCLCPIFDISQELCALQTILILLIFHHCKNAARCNGRILNNRFLPYVEKLCKNACVRGTIPHQPSSDIMMLFYEMNTWIFRVFFQSLNMSNGFRQVVYYAMKINLSAQGFCSHTLCDDLLVRMMNYTDSISADLALLSSSNLFTLRPCVVGDVLNAVMWTMLHIFFYLLLCLYIERPNAIISK